MTVTNNNTIADNNISRPANISSQSILEITGFLIKIFCVRYDDTEIF